MRTDSREEVEEGFAALHEAVSRVVGHSYDALTTPERLVLLERLEYEARRLVHPRHESINQIAEQATPEELGGKLSHALADRLHITRAAAARQVAEAADLGPRRAITGEPLEPRLPATAAAQRDGSIGGDHVAVIRQFFEQLPHWVDVETQQCAEQQLAQQAVRFRPDQVRKLADRLTYCLNPDGTFTDIDRARRRGLALGIQDIDGMSRPSGWLTPEARATLEVVLAKLAAPGMCNADDQTPVVDGAPGEEAIQRDCRSAGQHNHDALQAALRA